MIEIKSKYHKFQETFRAVNKLISILFRIMPFTLAVFLMTIVVAALIPLGQVYITQELINAATMLFQTNSSSLLNLYRLLFFQLSLQILLFGLNELKNYIQLSINIRSSLHFNELVSHKASKIPYSNFDDPKFYNLLQRATSGGEIRGVNIVFTIFQVLQNVISIVGYLIILITFHWVLGVFMLFLITPGLVMNIIEGNSRYSLMINQTPLTRKERYYSNLLKSREAAKEIRLFNIAEYLIHYWKNIYVKSSKEKQHLERKLSIRRLYNEITVVLLVSLITGFLLWLGARGDVTIGSYVALVQAIASTQGLLKSTAYNIAVIYENSLYTKDLFYFLDLKNEGNAEHVLEKYNFPTPIKQGINVENITFYYPNKTKPTISNLSFHIKAGEKVAIVGENGTGKSTLVKCLIGLYSPQSGKIKYDNIDIKKMDEEQLYKHVTAIFQDFTKFNLSLRENIGFGRIEFIDNDTLLREAAEKSGLNMFVSTLPDGLDTNLGHLFEGSTELSYGQWQKIAISRAFFRDFDVIVLDEPTASLDPLSEVDVIKNFLQLTEGKTAMYISHRLGSCIFADRIIVMKDGEIIEQGTHENLMMNNYEYARMFRSQAQWYEESKVFTE